MRVCIISNLFSPLILGGAEIYATQLAERLAEYDDVTVITSQPFESIKSLFPKRDIRDRIKIYSFYPMNLFHTLHAKNKPPLLKIPWHMLDIWNPHSFLAVRSILKQVNPDIVHTHNLNGLSMSIGGVLERGAFKWVHTAHDFSFLCPLATLRCPHNASPYLCQRKISPCGVYRLLKKRLIDNRPDLVVFPTQACREVFRERGFFAGQNNIILPYFTNVSGKSTIRTDSHFNILYVGQLVEHKGIGLLVDVFNTISRENWRLHIVGDGEYRATLERMASANSRITFYGRKSNADLHGLYSRADVTVVPSLWPEVLGIVILESLACSTPVIGSSTGGIPEIVKHGYNGLLTKPGHREELTHALEELASNTSLLKQLKANALNSAMEYRPNIHISRMRQAYARILG